MGIVDEDIERVRNSTDIVKLVSEHTQLKRVGTRWSGLCPFHTEKTGSFSVNSQEGLYHCFGCKKSGDAITFVRELEHLDFPGAIEYLARRAGLSLRYTDANEAANRSRRKTLIGHVERAAEIYHEWLLKSPAAGEARGYLRERGFDGEMVRRFRVGYAPDTWDALAKELRISDTDLADSGLGKLNRIGKQMDWQRGRIVFPVFDERGDAIGFGGRILPGGEGAKYINSQECSVYSKSRILYGLNWAKESIVSHGSGKGEAIICEGYTDVTGFSRVGIDRAVATCGTALTDDHVKLLRRFTNRLVLAFDADDAGKAAAERVYAWERQHELDIAVADLPQGADPDDLSRTDPDRLSFAIENAKPFLQFRIDRVLGTGHIESAEQRARLAEQALPLVAEHPNELVRDQYIMDIAARCRFEPDRLREMMRNPNRRQRRAGPVPTEAPAASPVLENVEDQALQLLIKDADSVREFLSAGVFAGPSRRETYVALTSSASVREALEVLGSDEGDLLRRVAAMPDDELDPPAIISRILSKACDRLARALESEARVSGDADALRDVRFLRQWVIELREPPMDLSTLAPLAGWISGRDSAVVA